MLKGFQQRITYKGLPFTIDTLDKGLGDPMLSSSLLFEGIVIAAEKIPYDDIIKFERLEQVLEPLMLELNERVQTQLTEGFYDAVIERHCGAKSDQEMTPVEAVRTIVMPFIEERFGGTIAGKIENDIVSGPQEQTGDDRDLFIQLCKKILDYRIGNTLIFPMMFGEHTETLLKEWLSEFNTYTYSSFSSSEISAENAMNRHVLPDLQNQIGKYMTFKLWESIGKERLPLYDGLKESEKFLKLCQDLLASVVGFYSEEESEEKLKSWYEQSYPERIEEASKPAISASDAVWKIAHPDIEGLLGKYMADKLILDAIERVPSRGRYEYGKFIDIISVILTNDLIINLCDNHWIDKRRRDWVENYDQLSGSEVGSHKI